jgi:hypothetical protein
VQVPQTPRFVTTLSAMISPVVIMAACTSLILVTTGRVGRTIARARDLGEEFRRLATSEEDEPGAEEELRMLFHQLEKSARRVELLQHAAVVLYSALGVFVLVSVAIGAQMALHDSVPGLVTGLGFVGALLLLYASITMIREALLTRDAMRDEMEFLRDVRATFAPPSLLGRRRAR